MNYDSIKHHRRSIRLKGYDYARAGAYFVTLVTCQRECLFGEIRAGEMHPNQFGALAENEWRRLGGRFPRIMVDDWIVMPNHIHGILVITEKGVGGAGIDGLGMNDVGAGQKSSIRFKESSLAPPLQAPTAQGTPNRASTELVSGSLGAIMRAYKSITARLINGLRRTPGTRVWQRNYYEHIIRNETEWARIGAYIRNNPARWDQDDENPEVVARQR